MSYVLYCCLWLGRLSPSVFCIGIIQGSRIYLFPWYNSDIGILVPRSNFTGIKITTINDNPWCGVNPLSSMVSHKPRLSSLTSTYLRPRPKSHFNATSPTIPFPLSRKYMYPNLSNPRPSRSFRYSHKSNSLRPLIRFCPRGMDVKIRTNSNGGVSPL